MTGHFRRIDTKMMTTNEKCVGKFDTWSGAGHAANIPDKN